jgi:bacterioferritin-associated ferredoxin
VKGALTNRLGRLNLRSVYVCHCRAVSDRVVKAAVAAGDRTVEDIGASCGAGTDCGGCHRALARLLGTHDRELVSVGAPDCA